jgi:pimeloyl-ACP methyl ester carboxylesterase
MDKQPTLHSVAAPPGRLVQVAPDVSLAAYQWEGGSLRPFVLLHGLASNAHLWDGVAAELARLGHAVVSIDQRGHGQSSKPDSGYDFITVTNDLAALVAAVGFERPVICGQSWGGNVVVEFAARFPGVASGIVPVDGGFISLGERFETWDACAAQLAPPRFAGTPAAQFEGWITNAHPDWPEVGVRGTFGNVEYHADGTISPWLTFERHMLILRELYGHRPLTSCESIEDPVLWLVADADAAWTTNKRVGVDAAHHVLTNRGVDSRVEWMVGDHDLHAQYPVQVATLLHDAVLGGFFG